jgi:hypothetical protein
VPSFQTSESETTRYTPDWAKSRQRWAAFWDRQIIDRPIVIAGALRPGLPPPPERPDLTPREKALDIEYQLARFAAAMAATRPYEFDTIMRELRPEGVITRVIADATPDQADAFVRHLARWV